ncbi:histidine kinase [Kocuria rhizophila]|nr:histidine kinase [Kocuria rhizophila]
MTEGEVAAHGRCPADRQPAVARGQRRGLGRRVRDHSAAGRPALRGPPMSTPTRTAPRPRAEPEHDWSDLLFATVWLVFLVIPAAALLQSDEPVWATALGLLGLVLFAGLYTLSWIRHILVPRLSVLGNAVLWCVVLLVPSPALSALPASPWGMTYMAPFFVAVRVPAAPAPGDPGLAPDPRWQPGCRRPAAPPGAVVLAAVRPGPVRADHLLSRFAVERSRPTSRPASSRSPGSAKPVGRDVHDILAILHGHHRQDPARPSGSWAGYTAARRRRARRRPASSREALADVRSTVGKLRDLDLGVELVRRHARPCAPPGSPLHLPSSVPPLDAATRSAFAWILREAVTNVVRHSALAHCRVTVTSSSLRIADDGARARGFPSPLRADRARRSSRRRAPSTSRPRTNDAVADAPTGTGRHVGPGHAAAGACRGPRRGGGVVLRNLRRAPEPVLPSPSCERQRHPRHEGAGTGGGMRGDRRAESPGGTIVEVRRA